MRVLIAAAAILACATAGPSGLLAAAPYAAYGHLGYAAAPIAHAAPLAYAAAPIAHAAPLAYAAAPLAPAQPTISSGDIAAASINAHVDASDHARASYDATRQLHDQASEIHGQHINAAESNAWQAVDAVKTAEAQLDGAAAGAAPQIAKSLVAPVAYAAPAAYAHAAPVAYAAPAAYAHAAPVAYAAPAAYAHAAPVAYAAPAAYAPAAYAAAPAYSKSISTQSLSQTHPSQIYSAPAYAHAAPLSYAAHAW